MYNKITIILGYNILAFLLISRLFIISREDPISFLSLLGLLTPIILSTILGFIGSNIRFIVRNPNLRGIRIFSHIFMTIVLIEMIVWISILFVRNPGLTGFFIPLFFLPYGFFFVKKTIPDIPTKETDIFELYEKDIEDDDIFAQYLNTHKKDKH